MTIKTVFIPAGGGLDHVTVGSTQPVEPGAGEITVRLRASSLNFHDYMMVTVLVLRLTAEAVLRTDRFEVT